MAPPRVFCVRRSKPQLILPETETSRDVKQVSDIDDQGSLRVQVAVLMAYKNNQEMGWLDPVEVIKIGLGKALVLYHPLAGRVIEGQNKKLVVMCFDDKGVWFVPAKANVGLEELGVESLQPPCPHLNKLLQHVTRFTCGGFVLAIRFNHTMIDSQGLVQFLNAVYELGHGGATAPSILPVWERDILSARPTPRISCTHKEFEESDESKTAVFHGKSVDVEKLLKNLRWIFGEKLLFDMFMIKRSFTFGSRELQAIKDQCPENCTTFEALTACLWKCRTAALHPHPNATVRLTFVVNVRERLQGGIYRLDPGYYGNAFVSVAAVTTAELLCTRPVGYAAELIREAKNSVNEDYIKSVADLMVLKGRPKWSVLRNFLIADNTRLGLDEMGDVAKDLTAGTVGGVAQLICGHPFDTIKVKLQSQPAPLPGQAPKYSGAMDAVRQTIAAEGPRGLYKGMGAPLATVAAFNALLFTVRGQMETLVRSEPGARLTVSQQIICGAGAGTAVSFLACPTELIKCRLQAQSVLAVAGGDVVAAVKYSGPMDVVRHVLRSEGGTMGLFKGLVPTLAREVPGNAAMFGVYEAIKQYLAGGQDTAGLGRGSLIVAGGLAGASYWVSVYPTDVIKSVIQVDDYKNPKFSGSFDAFKKILASEGVKGLYKGFGPAMARSVPANAACFLAYEVTRSSLG
nr:mitochondrial carnitine/acylcarnitine carrier-like protein [Ipomoea batatas]